MTSSTLFLCHRLPYPPNKGDKIRSYALLRHLAKRGPVHLACFVDDAEDLKYLDKVRELAGGDCYFEPLGPAAKAWRSLVGLVTGKPLTTACFGSRRLQQWVDRTLRGRQIGNIVIFGSAMAPYMLNGPIATDRVLFDMVDIDSDKWRQYAAGSRGATRWLYAREGRKLEALECSAAKAFGFTLLASDFEADTFRRNFWVCAIDDPSAFLQRDVIGIENILVESDYPHADSTWPHTQERLAAQLAGLSDDETARVTWKNASELFRHAVPEAVQQDPNAF